MIILRSLYKFFVLIAGVDKPTLDTCTRYEKIKQSGMGMLIMIPCILGTISMSFAISILTDNPTVYLSIGFLWGLIVLAIDRFLISAFHKSESVKKDFFSWKFLLRLIFSIGIGMMVSHPLVLFILDDKIKDYLSKDYTNQQNNIINDFNQESDDIEKSIIDYKNNFIKPIEDEIRFLGRYRQAESTSTERDTMTFNNEEYIVSGEDGRWRRFDEISRDIDSLQATLRSKKEDFEQFKQNKYSILKAKENQKDTALINLKENYAKGYLSGTIALSRLENDPIEGEPTRQMKIFLLLFFIFVDILPIVLKLTLDIGEYDIKIKKKEYLNISLFNHDFENQKELESRKREISKRFSSKKLSSMSYSDFENIDEVNEFMGKL
ncbi:MAG: DUF4407 domain-containing protein [Spirosomataceae bacterium]